MSRLANIARSLRTISYLRPVQLTNRITRRLFRARPEPGPPPPRRALRSAFQPACTRPPSLHGNSFRALNVERDIAGPQAWNAGAQKLWLYNLHYFDDLLREDAGACRAEHATLIARWIAQNPPGKGTGWEPYPNAIRIVNWCKWALQGGTLTPPALESLAVQARFLARTLEYHLLGNHLFANAKALVFAGLFFEGPEAQGWLQLGEKILARELPEQILADGGHFELSPTYHAVITEDVLDLINLTAAYACPERFGLPAIALRMLNWLEVMTRPDGLPPFFNDSTLGVSPLPAGILDYAARLGLPLPAPPGALSWLPQSGYARLSRGALTVIADLGEIGPRYLPGHGHCDMLSFELMADRVPVLVNTGTSTYEAGARRMHERGTEAHNTVQVDGAEQSEIWGIFRVGRRAHPHVTAVTEAGIEAWHDGYARLGLRHHRHIFWQEQALHVVDTCEGRDLPACAFFHLHPAITPRQEGQTVFLGPVALKFAGADAVTVASYEYAPGFNRRIPAQMVKVRFRGRLHTEILGSGQEPATV